jgi:hypothetical protein
LSVVVEGQKSTDAYQHNPDKERPVRIPLSGPVEMASWLYLPQVSL